MGQHFVVFAKTTAVSQPGQRPFHNPPYFFNSVVIAGIALSLQVLVSTLAAYALARKRFVGAAVVTLLILSTMMMPE